MKRLIVFIIFCLTCISCNKSVEPDFSYITDPHARWQAYGFKNYSIDQRLSCFCISARVTARVFVKDNHVDLVVDVASGDTLPSNGWDSYKMVEELFTLIHSINKDSVAALNVKYDTKYGYPVSIYVDPVAQIADEEYGYDSNNLAIGTSEIKRQDYRAMLLVTRK